MPAATGVGRVKDRFALGQGRDCCWDGRDGMASLEPRRVRSRGP
ncbi:MAG: hypothetical protein FD152_2367, partial [Xanthobacteraceae bacterium]